MAAELAIEENTKSDNRLLGMTRSTGPSLLPISMSRSDVLAHIHPIPFVVVPPPQQAVGDWSKPVRRSGSGSEAMRRVLTQRQRRERKGRGGKEKERSASERERTTKGDRIGLCLLGQGKDETTHSPERCRGRKGGGGPGGLGRGWMSGSGSGSGSARCSARDSAPFWRRVTLLCAICPCDSALCQLGLGLPVWCLEAWPGVAWRRSG
jgi:hypothetical protein